MEAAPPSYETATRTGCWDIIAPYIPARDLCACSLVCSIWHDIFNPHLWGNPASHFGLESDDVYSALTTFRRTLHKVRLEVRSLTHTLHFPPSHAELYHGPHAEWLRDILDLLPNLQSLIVRGLPFFDHASLQALRHARKKTDKEPDQRRRSIQLPGRDGRIVQVPSSIAPSVVSPTGLRLLDASRCPNVTSHSLAETLNRFEGLLYLDLSFTAPAREDRVLATLKRFNGLQVLKLRGIGLRDEAVETLTKAIGLRTRSLDVRDNYITDRGVRGLMDRCFLDLSLPRNRNEMASGRRSPALLPYLGSEMLEIYQGEDFEGYLRNVFTGRFVDRLAIEEVPARGITHLYIAGNVLTADGVSELVKSERLHVLDIGSVKINPTWSSEQDNNPNYSMPSTESLTPVFAKHSAGSLTLLRVDHSLITKEFIPSPDAVGPSAVDPQEESVESTEFSSELQTPPNELDSHPMQVSTSHGRSYSIMSTETGDFIEPRRRSGVWTPETLDSDGTETGRSSPIGPVPTLDMGTVNDVLALSSQFAEHDLTSPTSSGPRPRSYSSMDVDRERRLSIHMAHRHNLHPAMLPHVITLVLTNVPPISHDPKIIERLVEFVKSCAREALFAHNQAHLDYSMPPGRGIHLSALKYSANKIFALKRLVLEMAPEQKVRQNNTKASPWHLYDTRSVTEDRDSEAFYSATKSDYSFFADEDGGSPNLEPESDYYQSGSKENEATQSPPSYEEVFFSLDGNMSQPKFDTIALLSAFRKERKLAYHEEKAAGKPEPETDGYWDGLIQVIRSSEEARNEEEKDYYGNKFLNIHPNP